MFGQAHTTKPGRKGSSYIPTPPKLSNPRSGLIHIQNHDIECFKWCMKYHQSPQAKHSHRLTNLKKVEDMYNYNDISYPVGSDDITNSEDNNKLMINVWKMEENGNIFYKGREMF